LGASLDAGARRRVARVGRGGVAEREAVRERAAEERAGMQRVDPKSGVV
jgi:hypothetical protein